MSRVCPSCHYDAGFDAAICPECGYGAPGGAPPLAGGYGPTVVDDGRTMRDNRRRDRTVLQEEATRVSRSYSDGAYFFVKAGPEMSRSFELDGLTRIGRGSECEVRLSDPRVSGQHAQVREVRGRYVFQDLEATNHSYLLVGGDARRIRGPHTLNDGDEVRLGNTILKFIAPGRRRSR